MKKEELIPGKRYWLDSTDHAEYVGTEFGISTFKDVKGSDLHWNYDKDGLVKLRLGSYDFKEVTHEKV